MATSSTLGLKVVRYNGSCEMFQINCVFYRPLNSKYAHCSKLKTMVNTLLKRLENQVTHIQGYWGTKIITLCFFTTNLAMHVKPPFWKVGNVVNYFTALNICL